MTQGITHPANWLDCLQGLAFFGSVAKWLKHRPHKPTNVGSIPTRPTKGENVLPLEDIEERITIRHHDGGMLLEAAIAAGHADSELYSARTTHILHSACYVESGGAPPIPPT